MSGVSGGYEGRWIVTTIAERPGWYRWEVRGRHRDTGGSFAWAVPSLEDEGYDRPSVVAALQRLAETKETQQQ